MKKSEFQYLNFLNSQLKKNYRMFSWITILVDSKLTNVDSPSGKKLSCFTNQLKRKRIQLN